MSISFCFEAELNKSLAEIKNSSAKIGDIKKEQDLESEELEQLYSEVFLMTKVLTLKLRGLLQKRIDY